MVLDPPGVWLYLWPGEEDRWDAIEPHFCLPELVNWDLAGVIVQAGLAAPAWCAPERVEAFGACGLSVAVGIGARTPDHWEAVADSINHGLDRSRDGAPGRTVGVSIDAEQTWEGHSVEADSLVLRVITEHPEAPARCTLFGWYAPLSLHGVASHTRWPYKSFLGLSGQEIYVDAYGAGKPGRSAEMLTWARGPTQWPLLGVEASRVFATVQGRGRSLGDHLGMLMSEPRIVVWNFLEMDAVGRYALLARAALRRAGFDGPNAVTRFQSAHGMVPDGIFGPATAAAAGLPVPPEGA